MFLLNYKWIFFLSEIREPALSICAPTEDTLVICDSTGVYKRDLFLVEPVDKKGNGTIILFGHIKTTFPMTRRYVSNLGSLLSPGALLRK